MKKLNITKDIIRLAMQYCGGKEALAIQLDRSARSVELYLRNEKAPENIVRLIQKMADKQKRKLVK